VDDSSVTGNRREWLLGLLTAGFGGGVSLTAHGADGRVRAAGVPLPGTPAEHLRQLVRMQGSLREQDVPWWFTGVIFAVTGDDQTPRPLVRFEGFEVYWFQHVDDGYRLGGHTVTFFRDFETREFLYEFRNPWTGRTDVVKPAVQGGNLAFHYGVDGIWPVRLSGEPLGTPVTRPLWLQWHAMGQYVWLQHQTVYPPGMPPMHGQRQSMFAARRDYLDRRVVALPAAFSSTVFMGWLKWMDMKDHPGHVIWHASGVKLRSIDELPRDYRDRIEREYPERLSARPKPGA
jgi:hypothetical protein